RPQMADARVLDDAVEIVEDERTAEAVGVGDQRGRDDEAREEPAWFPVGGRRRDPWRSARGRAGTRGLGSERATALRLPVGHERQMIASGARAWLRVLRRDLDAAFLYQPVEVGGDEAVLGLLEVGDVEAQAPHPAPKQLLLRLRCTAQVIDQDAQGSQF